MSRAPFLFIHLGIAGGMIILVVWLWQGRLVAGLRQEWHFFLNRLLCRPFASQPPRPASLKSTSIP